MHVLRLTAGLLLLGTAIQSSALSIGRPSGNAWIGKPLDLTIPLELDRSESGDSLCLEAEVLQGDARVDDKRVTLSMDPGPSPDMPRVRLRTTRAIEEPVVTVKFTAGCVTKSTRQYVLLADLPEAPPVMASPPRLAAPDTATARGSDSIASPPPPRTSRSARAAAGGASRPAAADGEGTSSQPSPAPPRRRVATAAPTPSAANEAARKPKAQQPKPAASTSAAPAAEPKSRLQIEALAPEPGAQAPRPALAPAANAATNPTPAAVAAAPAAAAAPPGTAGVAAPAASADPNSAASVALAAATEQGRRDAERLKELEAALATLREQSAQTQRQLLELRGSLAQAEASRYRNPVIYGLLALLALALLGLLVLWRAARNARQAAWWGGSPEEEARAAAASAKPALPRHGELVDDDEDDEEDSPAAPADVSGLRSAAQGLRVTALPAGVGASAFHQPQQVRPVNAEELLDVQQQSDFFVSLGQHEQAIGVLREHIAANPDTSAMAYLDLLAVLHSLGRREDYAAVARDFTQGFNVDVPAFDNFTSGGRGLAHYREALQRIVAKWPSQGTDELIEEFVFRKPGTPEESFDLPAYQELLMLYAVARDLGEHEGPWAIPTPVRESPPEAVAPAHPENVYQPTSPMPYLPEGETSARPSAEIAPLELDLADLDRTAFETLRAPIEPAPAQNKQPAAPSVDPHVIDFDPFDPATNHGDLRPRHLGVKR